MKPFLEKFKPQIYSIFRIVVGFLFLWHGAQKLFGYPPLGHVMQMNAMMYAAGTIEFLGGVLVLLGLFTSIAAFIASGEMAVAYWMVHAPNAVLPIVNQGELAVLFCFAFLFICAKGAGLWSLDTLIFKKK